MQYQAIGPYSATVTRTTPATTGRCGATSPAATCNATITAVMAMRPQTPASIGTVGGGAGGAVRTCHDHASPSHHRSGAARHGSSYQPGGGDGGRSDMTAATLPTARR